jgi:hypothetical protein
MKFLSQVYTQASGSVGGLTYSHNSGGMYTRARRTPVNPATAEQQAVRNYLSQLSAAWSQTLTDAQRLAWDAYALAVPMMGKLGQPINIGGLGHYIRSNVPRLQAGLTRVDAGPTVLVLPDFTAPVITVTAETTASVAYTNSDDWAGEAGGAMLIYASRETNPSINFFKGPFRYAGKVAGAGTPPTSPYTATLPFACATGNKIHFQVRVCRADGRLSSPFRSADAR